MATQAPGGQVTARPQGPRGPAAGEWRRRGSTNEVCPLNTNMLDDRSAILGLPGNTQHILGARAISPTPTVIVDQAIVVGENPLLNNSGAFITHAAVDKHDWLPDPLSRVSSSAPVILIRGIATLTSGPGAAPFTVSDIGPVTCGSGHGLRTQGYALPCLI